MKTTSRFSLVLILAGSLCPASAQVTLTRVLEGDIATDTGYFWGCAWGDYDQDGYLDLFIARTRVDCAPENNWLCHNEGDGTFSKSSCVDPTAGVSDQGRLADSWPMVEVAQTGYRELFINDLFAMVVWTKSQDNLRDG